MPKVSSKKVSFRRAKRSSSKKKSMSSTRRLIKKLPTYKRNYKQKGFNASVGPSQKDGTNSSISYFSRVYKQQNPFYKQLKGTAVNTYIKQIPERLTANVGLQVFKEIITLDGGIIGSSTPGNEIDLLRNYILTSTNQGVKTLRYVVRSISEELLMTNQDNSRAEVRIYDIVCKRSCNSSITALVNGSLSDQGLTGWGTQVQGISPESVLRDNRYYYIQQKQRFILEAGESHIHKRYIKKNIMVNCDFLANDSFGNVKGITHVTLIVARGMPCNDSVIKTQVSTGTVTLDTIVNRQIRYSWLSDVTQTAHAVGGIVQGFTNAESSMMPQDAQIDLVSTAA